MGSNESLGMCFIRPHLCHNGYSISLWVKSLEEDDIWFKFLLSTDAEFANNKTGAGINMFFWPLGFNNVPMLITNVRSDTKDYTLPALHMENGLWYHITITANFGMPGVDTSSATVLGYVDGCLYSFHTDIKDRENAFDVTRDEEYRYMALGHLNALVVSLKETYEPSATWPDDIFAPFGLPHGAHTCIDELLMVETVLTPEEIWDIYQDTFIS